MPTGADSDSGRDKVQGIDPVMLEPEEALELLLAHPRVMAAQTRLDAGKPADLGLIIATPLNPYEKDKEPRFPGIAPTAVAGRTGGKVTLFKVPTAAANKATLYLYSVFIEKLPDWHNRLDALLSVLFEKGRATIAVTPRFQLDLDKSLAYIHARAIDVPAMRAPSPYSGEGVTVAVIDCGCDFVHRNFRKHVADNGSNGQRPTRLTSLYVQRNAVDATARRYLSAEIDAWLEQSNPYSEYDPHDQRYNFNAPVVLAHGTHVLDIAAGNGLGTGYPGVAPGADLVFYQPYMTDSDGNRYIDGAAIYHAAFEILRDAPEGMPLVINVSLNTNDGPHDTKFVVPITTPFPGFEIPDWYGLISLLFDADENRRGRALVVSAGNFYERGLHRSGKFRRSPDIFDLIIPKRDQRPNTIEIWFEADSLDTEIIVSMQIKRRGNHDTPGAPVAEAWSGETEIVRDDDGVIRGEIVGSRFAGLSQGAKLFFAYLTIAPPDDEEPLAEREVWRISLKSAKAQTITYHAWMQRDDGDQAQFRSNSVVQTYTLGACSGIRNAIVVGAFDARFPLSDDYDAGLDRDGRGLIAPFSSAGPTRDCVQRPDVSAPGHGVYAAWSKRDPGDQDPTAEPAPRVALSGCSMAAPHVTGIVALMLELRSRQRKRPLPTIERMRAALRASARPINPDLPAKYWHLRYGYGRADAARALEEIGEEDPQSDGAPNTA